MAYGLKYYLEFKNTDGLPFRTEINEQGYQGAAIALDAGDDPVTMDIPDGTVFEALRGTSHRLNLLATVNFTLDDLFVDDEKKFYVVHKQADNVLFRGYILPDGIEQSFVYDVWEIKLDVVDGIGLLKDLAFVDDAGLFFSGKMSVKDVILNCLKRIGLPEMNLYTSVNTYYEGADLELDTLAQTFVNTERYIKDAAGEHTPMNCEEVLRSVLDIFVACVAQYRGNWHIYKQAEVVTSGDASFFIYDGVTGDLTGTVTRDFSVALGSQINGAYPHHANENQRILIQKAWKSFRVNYKYGLLSSLTTNEQFKDFTNDIPDGWELVNLNPDFVNQHPRGLMIAGIANVYDFVRNSNTISLLAGAVVTVEITNGSNGTHKSRAYFSIYAGGYYLQDDLTWVNGDVHVFNSAYALPGGTAFSSITTPPLPIDADLEIRLHAGVPTDGGIYALYERVRTVPVKSSALPGLGEFHTVEQIYNYSFIPDNKIVYNGDNDDGSDVYVGSLYKPDGGFTSNWVRKFTLGTTSPDDPKPILRVMAEEYLRTNQRQYKKFTGGVFGFFDYISVVSIASLSGVFMPAGMEFNYKMNTGNVTLLEVVNSEIPGYDPTPDDELSLKLPGSIYTLTDDYGTPIKPLIR